MATEYEAKTTIVVADEASGPLKQIAKNAELAESTTEGARRAASAMTPANAAGAGGGGGGGGGGEGGGGGGDEDFALLVKERKERKKRLFAHRVEDQRASALTKAAEVSLGLLVSTQNQWAAKIAKVAGTSESVGLSLLQFGGKVGGVGSVLSSLGSYGAIASVALEATSYVLEKFGVNVEELQEHAMQASASFLGISTALDKAKSEGFATAEAKKAQEEWDKQFYAQRIYTEAIRGHAQEIESIGARERGSVDEHLATQKLVNALMVENAEYTKLGYDKVRDMVSEAASKTVSAQDQEATAHLEMAQMAKKHIAALEQSFEKGEEGALARSIAVMTEVNEMKAQGKIREDQAQMYASLTEAEIDKRTSIESETVAYYKMAKTKEDEELAVAAVMKAHKHLYPKVLKTAEDYDKLRRAIATSGQAVLTALKLTTGERLPEILSDIEGKALNKISHVNDFRGSHFDIKQAFAEGFDPDRIAVAFSNDLAVLGERQRQANSGIVSPLGVR